MSKRTALFLCLICMTFFLQGCAQNTVYSETTLNIKKNGAIVNTIVEDFSQDYYQLEGLVSMMEKECTSYNESTGKELVKIQNVEENNNIITAVMEYEDSAAYAGFNRTAFFVGTIAQAYNAGYDLNIELLCADGSDIPYGKEELLSMGEHHMVIMREAMNVQLFGDVVAYSDDVMEIGSSRKVMVTDSENLSYIVFD